MFAAGTIFHTTPSCFMEQFIQLDALSSECDLCCHQFCRNNDTFFAFKTPTESVSCDHVICQGCLWDWAAERSGYRWYMDCPCCLARHACRVSSSSRDPETSFRVTKTIRSGLLHVHCQPWNLSLELYPFMMERIGQLPSVIQSQRHPKSNTTKKKILQEDSMRKFSTWIKGIVQVHDFPGHDLESFIFPRRYYHCQKSTYPIRQNILVYDLEECGDGYGDSRIVKHPGTLIE